MEVLGLLVLLFLGWAAYRILISGPGNKKSFLRYYRDQNRLRKWIQDQGGIHKLESENISFLEEKGYEVKEYGENFISFRKHSDEGYVDLKIVYDQERQPHLQVGYSSYSDSSDPPFSDSFFSKGDDISEVVDQAMDRHFSARSTLPEDGRAEKFKIGEKGHGSQRTIYEGSKSVRAMVEEYTFLTESQMRTLRNGGSVDIVAKVDNIINHTNDEWRHRTALLKVGAVEAASKVDDNSYVNDNGETVIDWSDLVDIGLMRARHVYWKRDYDTPADIPVDEHVKQGMNVRCVVELDELPDGTETLNVVSLTLHSSPPPSE